jgi:hypothetical protein
VLPKAERFSHGLGDDVEGRLPEWLRFVPSSFQDDGTQSCVQCAKSLEENRLDQCRIGACSQEMQDNSNRVQARLSEAEKFRTIALAKLTKDLPDLRIRDTKGIFRVHQFEKVEQFVFCKPENSWNEHEKLISNAEEIFQALKLPYRVVNVCSGDLGTVAAKKYDLEVWLPGEQRRLRR